MPKSDLILATAFEEFKKQKYRDPPHHNKVNWHRFRNVMQILLRLPGISKS